MFPIKVSPKNTVQKIPRERITQFQKKVLTFYEKNKRILAWRQTIDPYKILLSEFMLQQTQVTRVIQYYKRWIARWPTIDALASASRTEVLQEWMGLGYNTRAVNLHKAAGIIVSQFQGNVLDAMNHYSAIPGVGKYTSQAVQIFSTNADLVTVDTNIRRILIKEFSLPETISDTDLWMLADRCLPRGNSRDWHNALMDYGALVLTAQKTGIKPKTTQPPFKGSDRQIRAKILRMLLQNDATLSTLSNALHVEQPRLSEIIEKMIHEEIIVKKRHQYSLKDS